MLAAPSRPPSSARGLLSALFEEAWQRRRSRHRWVGVLLLRGACVAATFLAARDGRQGSGRTGQQAVLRALVLSGAPGIGVACSGAPNSIACDRVGIAVSLPTRHARLRATIAGRSVQLHNLSTGACPRTGCFYSGSCATPASWTARSASSLTMGAITGTGATPSPRPSD